MLGEVRIRIGAFEDDGYQWLLQLSFARDSWTAPVDVRRVHPLEDDETIAVEQIRALLAQLGSSAAVPLFVFDAG